MTTITMPTTYMTPTLSDDLLSALQRKDRLSEADARRGLLEFEAWLSTTPSQVPSGLVDTVWHRFLLRTEAYANYCQQRFGVFIHHDPDPDAECSNHCGSSTDQT